MNDLELQTAIQRIPHLDLGLEFDVQEMANEAAKIDEWVNWRTTIGNNATLDKFHRVWKGRTLLNFSPDSRDGIREYTMEEIARAKAGQLPLFETDLATTCPAMLAAIRASGCDKFRARLMKIEAGGHLGWHCHTKKYKQAQNVVTVHLPIIMPPKFHYAVTREANVWWDEQKRSHVHTAIDVYYKWYPPGRCNIFNTHHYHNVFNNDTQPRISLMLGLNIFDPATRLLVETAVENYRVNNGPEIE